MKEIGLQLWSVRNGTGTEEAIKENFPKLRAMGYTQVQTADVTIPYERFGELAKEAGLQIVGMDEGFDLMESDMAKVADQCRALNTKIIVCGFRPKEPTPELWEDFIARANRVADRAASYGLKYCYHNHSHEYIRLSNGKTPMEMLKETLNTNAGFCLDTYWVQHGGGDVRSWIEKLAGRIEILHIKDMQRLPHFKEKTGYQMYTEVGSGNMEWPPILAAAEKAGVRFFVVEQDETPGDAMVSMQKSADYMKRFIN